MRLRVVCGLGVTMASFSPAMRLSSVDLPTFGRPRIAMVPATVSAVVGVVGAVGSEAIEEGASISRGCRSIREHAPPADAGRRVAAPRHEPRRPAFDAGARGGRWLRHQGW